MNATSHLYSVWVQTKVILYLVEQLLLQAGQGNGCLRQSAAAKRCMVTCCQEHVASECNRPYRPMLMW